MVLQTSQGARVLPALSSQSDAKNLTSPASPCVLRLPPAVPGSPGSMFTQDDWCLEPTVRGLESCSYNQGQGQGLGPNHSYAHSKRKGPTDTLSGERQGDGPPQGTGFRLVHLCQLIPDHWGFNLKGLACLWVVLTSDHL